MEREIVTAGTKIALSSLIANLQTDVQLNTARDFDQIFASYGVNCDIVSGLVPASDTSLKVTGVGLSQITVSEGMGLTSAFNYIDVATGDPGAQISVAALASGLHTVYIKYIGDTYEAVEVVNGFFYGDLGNTVDSREHASYELVFDTNPTVSGLVLADITIKENIGDNTVLSIDDRRNENVLKLKLSVLPDTVVKTDRDSDIDGKLTANYIGVKDSSGYEMLINDLGLTQNETCTASGIVEAHDWRHWHGNEVTQGSRTVLDSTNAIDAHDELYAAFRNRVMNCEDGYGDRLILTQIIPSKPNSVDDLSVTLREIVPDELVTKSMKDSIRSYTIKEIAIADNINAYTAIAAWRATIANYQTLYSAWDIDDLYSVSGLEATASGLWAQGYCYDAGGKIATTAGYYEDGMSSLGMREVGGSAISSALTTIDATLDYNLDANSVLDSDLSIIAKDILDKEAEVVTHPDKGKRSFEALCKWTEPALVDNEPIVTYQLRIFRLTTTSSSVPDSTSLTTLLQSYTAEIAKEIQGTPSFAEKHLILKSNAGGITVSGSSSTSTKIYVTDNGGIAAGQYFELTHSAVLYKGVIKNTGNDGTPYVTLALAIKDSSGNSPNSIDNGDVCEARGEEYESLDTYNIGGGSKTVFAFPIDVDQTYIIYVRPITKYGIAGDWCDGVKISTNSLTSEGIALNDLVKEDKAFLAKTKEVEKRELKRDFETQILALQQAIAALPTQDQLNNATDSLSALEARVDTLEQPS